MTRNKKKQCRWTTNRGERCKHTPIGRTQLCFKHNLTVRFRTQLIVGIITILVGAAIAFFLPEIRNTIFPEKTLLERVRIEGERATSIDDKTQVPAHAHNLCQLGLFALRNRDFAAYKQAIWQMLRVHTLSWTSQWLPGPGGRLARDEVYDQLVKLITTERLRYLTHRLDISGMLGDVAVAGTGGNIKEYNLGNFFSENLFTETLELMRRVIDILWRKGDTQFARFVFEVMRDVILAEAHRRMDQGYRICPLATDRPQLTASAQRIADVGQPRALDSYYRACRTISKVLEPLLTEFLTSDYYYRLSHVLAVHETVEDTNCKCGDMEILQRSGNLFAASEFLCRKPCY